MNELKTQIEKTMVDYLDGDSRRIAHARQVTAFVEQLVAQEQGDYIIVTAAGLLHDIGIHEAERKYHSNAGNYQEIEGPPIARSILQELEMSAGQIEEVCEIIAHHHSPGIINSRNFKILYDADWLVNLGDEFDTKDKNNLSGLIDKIFLTASGKVLAKQIYLNSPSTL